MKIKELGQSYQHGKKTCLSNWETRVKIVTCITVAFLLVPLKNPLALWGYALFLFSILYFSHLPLRKLLKRMLMLVPFLTFFSAPILLGAGFPPPPERVEIVLLIMGKAICTLFLLFIIVFTQPVQLIFNAIGHMNLPDKLVSVLFLSWRYVFLFWEKLGQTYKALSSRLLRGGINIRAYKIYGEIIGGLFVKSIDSSERVYKAMLSRGYSGKSTVGAANKITYWDLIKSAVMLISSVALYFI